MKGNIVGFLTMFYGLLFRSSASSFSFCHNPPWIYALQLAYERDDISFVLLVWSVAQIHIVPGPLSDVTLCKVNALLTFIGGPFFNEVIVKNLVTKVFPGSLLWNTVLR